MGGWEDRGQFSERKEVRQEGKRGGEGGGGGVLEYKLEKKETICTERKTLFRDNL